jgi:hypothetical protein
VKKTSKVLKKRPESDQASEPPSICSMLEVLKSLDAQVVDRTMIQVEKSKKIVQLRTELEHQLKEINMLDTSVTSFHNKCNLLKKELGKFSVATNLNI